MASKTILGLDLGTNSIGWALVEQDFENKKGNILGLGSRIIPMTQDVLGNFEAGGSHSQTANRTQARSTRKLYQRDNLRRERLHRVLNLLNFLPEHYKAQIDFITHKGQFINHSEPKLPYFKNHNEKSQFLFEDSFNEMVEEFRKTQPQLFVENKKIPYDWTIYYLRKKALTQKISKEELAWLILHFNQKRGYYQLSEHEEDNDTAESKEKEFVSLKVERIENSGETLKKTEEKLYNVYFSNGWKYDRMITKPIDWENKSKDFIVTKTITKNGEEKITFKAVDAEKDWIAIKKKTEQEIEKSQKTTGEFIYDALLQNPVQKIRGKLVKTIERKFYKAELEKILSTQIEFHSELKNKELYEACCMELYPNNDAHRISISSRDFLYLFIKDIIFYQRPLKTKTHLISDCELEFRVRFDTQEKVKLKCIAKSNPIFQEFRLWQFLANLRIIEKEKGHNGEDIDVTGNYLDTEEKWVELFEFLDEKEEITQKQLLSKFKLKEDKFRWNFPEDKTYPCNETKAKIINRIKRIDGLKELRLSKEQIQQLWHLLYSVTDPEEREKALKKFSDRNGLNDEFAKSFSKMPPYKKDYGSYSEKAIKKLLPLMRRGKFWNESEIPKQAIDRIVDIENRLNSIEHNTNELEKVADDVVSKAVLKSFIKTNGRLDALNTYQASYLVYGIHSESKDTEKWESSSYIHNYLKNEFKQHSLRNPIVEQVLTETLRVVKDIWDEFGNGEKGFFNEIHIELGREMKNDANTRKRISDKVTENENTNQRIKAVLTELMNEGVEVRPYSPSQQEILKIYEEGVYLSENRKEELAEIDKIRKSNSPSKSDINKYKLWLEQGYISPYTGKSIMLSELFSPKYQIEHIFPQSRFFDDSMSNKIICEAEVNQLKDNLTAFEFIEKYGGTIVQIGGGKNVKIFDLDAYQKHVLFYFAKNKTKRENLLSKEIPEKFLNRQLNDSRYISKAVKGLLSKIVREDGEVEATSKHITTISGSITSQMKQDWGLNDVWNDIIKPRFERMNDLTNSSDFGYINPNTNKFLPKVPEELAKGFNKKRIDHRHHALDAVVIACVTKDHVNYITSINTERKNYSLYSKLRKVEEIDKTITLPDGTTKIEKRKVAKDYLKPWDAFTQDVRKQLEKTVVSFKQNTRVINKTKNKFLKWMNTESGKIEKQFVPQTKGQNWAIRKSLHTPMPYGKRSYSFDILKIADSIGKWELIIDSGVRTKIQKLLSDFDGKVTALQAFLKKNPLIDENGNVILVTPFKQISEKYRKRKPISTLSNRGQGGIKTKEEALKFIDKIADFNIRRDLIEHFKDNDFDLDLAFNAEGLDNFNSKRKIPVFKLPIAESGEGRFPLGISNYTNHKYVEADKGTNLFFAIYKGINKKGEEVRYFETIPLNVAIEEMKQGGTPAKPVYFDKNKCQYDLLFTLSPNDLVYVPTTEEIENPTLVDFKNLSKSQVERIYKMVSSTGIQCFFIRNEVANSIKDKFEFSALNKTEKDLSGNMVKSLCWKLIINRLGQIEHIIY